MKLAMLIRFYTENKHDKYQTLTQVDYQISHTKVNPIE